MFKDQLRPTSKIKINSKGSITTTTMENRETTTVEKRESITTTTGRKIKRSMDGKTQLKCFTGWYRLSSISLNTLSEH